MRRQTDKEIIKDAVNRMKKDIKRSFKSATWMTITIFIVLLIASITKIANHYGLKEMIRASIMIGLIDFIVTFVIIQVIDIFVFIIDSYKELSKYK